MKEICTPQSLECIIPPNYIQNWFNKQKLVPIYDLLLEKYLNTQLYWSRYFLNMVVGIESFHKEILERKIDTKNSLRFENREKIKKILESQDDKDLLQFFRKSTSFWKKTELIEILNDQIISQKINSILLGVIEFKLSDLLVKIKKTRNDLAHKGVHLKEFKSDIEILLITKVLEYTLKILVLEYLGVNISDNRNNLIEQGNQLVSDLYEGNEHLFN